MLKRIAIIGAGPAGLYLLKKMIEQNDFPFSITFFEKTDQPGAGMPYSKQGASTEHVTNVSSNEIPELLNDVSEWLKDQSIELLKEFGINSNHFSEYRVLPRLLFGKYLQHQFNKLVKIAKAQNIDINLLLSTKVTDIEQTDNDQFLVHTKDKRSLFDVVIICTGHNWKCIHEKKVKGWFDSPYPPDKLASPTDFPVALRGASLTAIDAIKTLSRANGYYDVNEDGTYSYHLSSSSKKFKIVMHSLDGLLPAVRFHTETPQLFTEVAFTGEDLEKNKEDNDGFVSLDFIFEKGFKEALRLKDPEYYEEIRSMNLEGFVEDVMRSRKSIDAFNLLTGEIIEAEKSIRRKEPVYWKELLAVLSYSMNKPAKYFSAEDMLRLKKTLMPLISIVIAFVPQSSVAEMQALYKAGCLELVAVDISSKVEAGENGLIHYSYTNEEGQSVTTTYKMFVDCKGQAPLSYDEIPFKSLVEKKAISPAKLKFRSESDAQTALENGEPVEQDADGNYYLKVPGAAINDWFQAVDEYGAANKNLYIMAVPFIGGYNPDYSGLDFCDTASSVIATSIFEYHKG